MEREYWPQHRLRAELVTLYRQLALVDHATEAAATRRSRAEDAYRSMVDLVIARQRDLAVARGGAAREQLVLDAVRRRARPLHEAARDEAAARVAAIDNLLETIGACQEQVTRSAADLVAQAATDQPQQQLSNTERDEAIRWVTTLLDELPWSSST
jgi:hypothetical protein